LFHAGPIAGSNSYGITPDNGDLLTVPGASGPNYWTISSQYAGTICTTAGVCTASTPSNLISFNNIPNLQGSNNSDTYYPNALINRITGGSGGNDTLNYTNGYSGVTPQPTFGAGGSATNVTNSTNVQNIVTPSDSTLIGINGQLNVWDILGLNTVSLNGGLVMTGVTELVGANDGDIFNFFTGGMVSLISGGSDSLGGTEQLNFNLVLTNLNIALTGFGASHGVNGTASFGTNTFSSIDNIIGSSTNTNVLTGINTHNVTNAWSVSGANAGMVVASTAGSSPTTAALNFSNFATVQGGSGADTITATNSTADLWTLTNGNSTLATASGNPLLTFNTISNVTGSNQGDTFNVNANFNSLTGGGNSSSVNTFNFVNGNVTRVSGGNYNSNFYLQGGYVTTLLGGNGSNTLIGNSGNNTWNISGNNSGSVNGVNSFSQIQNIVGGSANNTFNFTNYGKLTGSLNGGGTNVANTLNYASYTPVTFTFTSNHGGNVGNIAGGFQNITTVVGDNADEIYLANGSKTNVVHINGALQGYVNDPTSFTGISMFGSAPGVSTQVIFDALANFNIGYQSALVNGGLVYFFNIQNFSGNIVPAYTAAQNAVISSAIDSTLTPNNPSASTANTATVTSEAEMVLQTSIGLSNVVGENITTITKGQSDNDISITNSQKVETNCS
jgi:hypothetical protein